MVQHNQEENRVGGSLLGKATVRNFKLAFNDAINAGVLSTDRSLCDCKTDGTSIYVKNWMYMYSLEGYDYFKNIAQRHYITNKIPEGS